LTRERSLDKTKAFTLEADVYPKRCPAFTASAGTACCSLCGLAQSSASSTTYGILEAESWVVETIMAIKIDRGVCRRKYMCVNQDARLDKRDPAASF